MESQTVPLLVPSSSQNWRSTWFYPAQICCIPCDYQHALRGMQSGLTSCCTSDDTPRCMERAVSARLRRVHHPVDLPRLPHGGCSVLCGLHHSANQSANASKNLMDRMYGWSTATESPICPLVEGKASKILYKRCATWFFLEPVRLRQNIFNKFNAIKLTSARSSKESGCADFINFGIDPGWPFGK